MESPEKKTLAKVIELYFQRCTYWPNTGLLLAYMLLFVIVFFVFAGDTAIHIMYACINKLIGCNKIHLLQLFL